MKQGSRSICVFIQADFFTKSVGLTEFISMKLLSVQHPRGPLHGHAECGRGAIRKDIDSGGAFLFLFIMHNLLFYSFILE